MLRGRGRPPKEVQEFYWADVPAGIQVSVYDERGPWKYVKRCDRGASITVQGGSYGHTRTFDASRVVIKLKDLIEATVE